MVEITPLTGEGPFLSVPEIAEIFQRKSFEGVPPKDALEPYSQITGIDLFNLREHNYEGLAIDEPPNNEDLEGYFDQEKKEDTLFIMSETSTNRKENLPFENH